MSQHSKTLESKIEDLEKRLEWYRERVVWCYGGEYMQGSAGEMELAEPITAHAMNIWKEYVDELEYWLKTYEERS